MKKLVLAWSVSSWLGTSCLPSSLKLCIPWSTWSSCEGLLAPLWLIIKFALTTKSHKRPRMASVLISPPICSMNSKLLNWNRSMKRCRRTFRSPLPSQSWPGNIPGSLTRSFQSQNSVNLSSVPLWWPNSKTRWSRFYPFSTMPTSDYKVQTLCLPHLSRKSNSNRRKRDSSQDWNRKRILWHLLLTSRFNRSLGRTSSNRLWGHLHQGRPVSTS